MIFEEFLLDIEVNKEMIKEYEEGEEDKKEIFAQCDEKREGMI